MNLRRCRSFGRFLSLASLLVRLSRCKPYVQRLRSVYERSLRLSHVDRGQMTEKGFFNCGEGPSRGSPVIYDSQSPGPVFAVFISHTRDQLVEYIGPCTTVVRGTGVQLGRRFGLVTRLFFRRCALNSSVCSVCVVFGATQCDSRLDHRGWGRQLQSRSFRTFRPNL